MKKLFLLLNLFTATHFIIHHANSAQPDGGQPAAPKEVPSLKNL